MLGEGRPQPSLKVLAEDEQNRNIRLWATARLELTANSKLSFAVVVKPAVDIAEVQTVNMR